MTASMLFLRKLLVKPPSPSSSSAMFVYAVYVRLRSQSADWRQPHVQLAAGFPSVQLHYLAGEEDSRVPRLVTKIPCNPSIGRSLCIETFLSIHDSLTDQTKGSNRAAAAAPNCATHVLQMYDALCGAMYAASCSATVIQAF